MVPFMQKETKEVMWDYESSQSPRPNGFNFGFIKDFQEVLKANFVAFMKEFYLNGRLPRDANSFFTMLILKKDCL